MIPKLNTMVFDKSCMFLFVVVGCLRVFEFQFIARRYAEDGSRHKRAQTVAQEFKELPHTSGPQCAQSVLAQAPADQKAGPADSAKAGVGEMLVIDWKGLHQR